MVRRRVRLSFGRGSVTEPVIYELGRKHGIVTNIRRAEITNEGGWVLLELMAEPEVLERGMAYLETLGVRVDPAEGDLIE